MAIGALCALWSTMIQLGLDPRMDALALNVFAATLCSYTLHRLLALEDLKRLEVHSTAIMKWSVRWKWALRILFLCGLLGSIISFFALNSKVQITLCLTGLITVFYSYPILPSATGKRRLRDIGIAKIFLIALIWAVATVYLPILQYQLKQGINEGILILQRFCFMIAITIPFDIRDLNYDKEEGLSTLPSLLGIKKARLLGLALLVFVTGLCLIRFSMLQAISGSQLIAFVITYLVTAILIQGTNQNRSDHFFIGAIDGTLVLMFVLLLFA